MLNYVSTWSICNFCGFCTLLVSASIAYLILYTTDQMYYYIYIYIYVHVHICICTNFHHLYWLLFRLFWWGSFIAFSFWIWSRIWSIEVIVFFPFCFIDHYYHAPHWPCLGRVIPQPFIGSSIALFEIRFGMPLIYIWTFVGFFTTHYIISIIIYISNILGHYHSMGFWSGLGPFLNEYAHIAHLEYTHADICFKSVFLDLMSADHYIYIFCITVKPMVIFTDI